MTKYSSCISLRTALVAACCLALSGCDTLSGNPASASSSTAAAATADASLAGDRFADGTYGFMLSEVPRIPGARPLASISTLAAFQGDGVYYFNDTEESSFRVVGKAANGRYSVKESYQKGKPHGFAWGTNVQSIVRNGRSVNNEFPDSLTEDKDGFVTLYSNSTTEPIRMRLKLWAFDVSGQYVYHYLRRKDNFPTDTAHVTNEKFPAGSVAYMAQIFMPEDNFVVLNPDSFTGASSVEAFARNFSREIPYCLSHLPRQGANPYGVMFDASKLPSGTAKTTYQTVTKTRWVKNKKGKKVKQTYQTKVAVVQQPEMPASGEVNLLEVKSGTVFCEKTAPKVIATGKYNTMTLNGTRGMSLDFPASKVPAPDMGIFELSRNAVSIALVEMKRSNGTAVVPGYHVRANMPITDFQYRFNATAAKAVRQAIAGARAEVARNRAQAAK